MGCMSCISPFFLLSTFVSFVFCSPTFAIGSYAYNGSIDDLREYLLGSKNALVFIGPGRDIHLKKPLEFSGNSIEIIGAGGRIIDLSGAGILRLNEVRSVELSELELITSPSSPLECIDQDCSGIFVSGREGNDLSIALKSISVIGAGGHGIHIVADDSSVFLSSRNSSISSAGWFLPDRDGIRVDQTGSGSINWHDKNSSFVGNGGDGVELDEAGAGSVAVRLSGSVFEANGAYCFGRSEEVGCLQISEQTGFDLDDGFDIDEQGAGDVKAYLDDVTVLSNFDEGVDFDELDSGYLYAEIKNSTILSWFDDSISLSGGGEAGDYCLLDEVISDIATSLLDGCTSLK